MTDPRYLAHVARTLVGIQAKIAAMERVGAVGVVLDEARRHAADLNNILEQAKCYDSSRR